MRFLFIFFDSGYVFFFWRNGHWVLKHAVDTSSHEACSECFRRQMQVINILSVNKLVHPNKSFYSIAGEMVAMN